MKIKFSSSKLFLLFLLTGLNYPSGLAESIDKGEREEIEQAKPLDKAPLSSTMQFSVVIMDQSGWSETEVRGVIQQAARIFSRECRVDLNPVSFELVIPRRELRLLTGDLQEQLVEALGNRQRPIVFFIYGTDSDDIAYAYLEETVSPSQGTAWITRRSTRECRGVLLAHELGHIALQYDGHDTRKENLMSSSCRLSNINSQPLNTRIGADQCQLLWRRYGEAQVSGAESQ